MAYNWVNVASGTTGDLAQGQNITNYELPGGTYVRLYLTPDLPGWLNNLLGDIAGAEWFADKCLDLDFVIDDVSGEGGKIVIEGHTVSYAQSLFGPKFVVSTAVLIAGICAALLGFSFITYKTITSVEAFLKTTGIADILPGLLMVMMMGMMFDIMSGITGTGQTGVLSTMKTGAQKVYTGARAVVPYAQKGYTYVRERL